MWFMVHLRLTKLSFHTKQLSTISHKSTSETICVACICKSFPWGHTTKLPELAYYAC